MRYKLLKKKKEKEQERKKWNSRRLRREVSSYPSRGKMYAHCLAIQDGLHAKTYVRRRRRIKTSFGEAPNSHVHLVAPCRELTRAHVSDWSLSSSGSPDTLLEKNRKKRRKRKKERKDRKRERERPYNIPTYGMRMHLGNLVSRIVKLVVNIT